MMGPGSSGGGKDMGGFMKSFAGNLGSQMSGMNLAGNPMSGLGMMKQMMGGEGGGPADEQNPGAEMFGKKSGGNGFLEKFGGNLSDQLFQRAMMGFMGN